MFSLLLNDLIFDFYLLVQIWRNPEIDRKCQKFDSFLVKFETTPRLKMDSEHRINKKKSSRFFVFIGIQNYHGAKKHFLYFALIILRILQILLERLFKFFVKCEYKSVISFKFFYIYMSAEKPVITVERS